MSDQFPYVITGIVRDGDNETEYDIGSARTGFAAQRAANQLMRRFPDAKGCCVWVSDMEYTATPSHAVFGDDGEEAVRDVLEAASNLLEFLENQIDHLNHLLSARSIVTSEEKARIAARTLTSIRNQTWQLKANRTEMGPERAEFVAELMQAQVRGDAA